MCHYDICVSCRLVTIAGAFEETPPARPYIAPFRDLTAGEVKTLVMSRAWRAAARDSWSKKSRASNATVQQGAFALASFLQLFSELTTNGGSPSEGVLLKESASVTAAEVKQGKQIRNYFVSLALYIKKFPTDAIVAYLKTNLPSSHTTLDCGPEKIEGGSHYITLAAIAVATGAPQALCRSLIMLKLTTLEAKSAFHTVITSCRNNVQTEEQATEEYETFGSDSIELHPRTFQVHCRCRLSSLLPPCLLRAPACYINTYHHYTRWLQLPTIYAPVRRTHRVCRPKWLNICVLLKRNFT